MTRYFTALASGRPLEVGGRSFVFELVSPLGGGWLGVLAEADEASASILAAHGVDEITEERYNTLKKKRQTGVTPPASQRLPKPPPAILRLAPSADPAAPRPTSTATEPEKPAAPVVTGPSISLQVTDKAPPPEPLLDDQPKKTRRAKK